MIRVISVVVLSLAAASCQTDPATFAERHTSLHERQFAFGFIALLEQGQVDSAFALLAADLQTPAARDEVTSAGALLSAHPVDSLVLIGVEVSSSPGVRTVNLTWEQHANEQRILAYVYAEYRHWQAPRVIGFGLTPMDISMREANAFSLRNTSLVKLTWLIAILGAPLVCVSAAIRIARSKGMPNRWPWACVALIGFVQVSMNWTTGDISVHPLSVLLLAASAFKAGPAAPWILSWGIPVGAIIGLLRYRKWRVESAQQITHSEPETAV